jgi:hypothetical protein
MQAVHGVTALLRPAAWAFSPAIGAAVSHQQAAHRLLFADFRAAAALHDHEVIEVRPGRADVDPATDHSCAAPAAAGELARQLFHCVGLGAPLKPSAARSHPAAWLADPAAIGAVVGLACAPRAADRDDARQRRAALQEAGISTNTVCVPTVWGPHSERTGVSLARWERLLGGIRRAGDEGAPPAAVLQFLCLRAQQAGPDFSSFHPHDEHSLHGTTRLRLLEYLRAVDAHVPVLAAGAREQLADPGWCEAFAALPAPAVVGGVTSDCHFKKTATEYDRKPGIKWLRCTEK